MPSLRFVLFYLLPPGFALSFSRVIPCLKRNKSASSRFWSIPLLSLISPFPALSFPASEIISRQNSVSFRTFGKKLQNDIYMRTKVPVILLSVLALLFHACGGKDTQDKQELSVSTSQVTALPQNGNKEFPFIARPFRTSELSFRVGGPIDRFDVYAGNQYERGNIIAEIDPRDFRIRKERAEAVYAKARPSSNA